MHLEKRSLRHRKRTKMKNFLISEISAVNNPAQEDARAILMKREDPQRSRAQTRFSDEQHSPKRRRRRRRKPMFKGDPEKLLEAHEAQQRQLDRLDKQMKGAGMTISEDTTRFRDSRPMSKEQIEKLRDHPQRFVPSDAPLKSKMEDHQDEKSALGKGGKDFYSRVDQIKKDRNISHVEAMQIARQEHPDELEKARAG